MYKRKELSAMFNPTSVLFKYYSLFTVYCQPSFTYIEENYNRNFARKTKYFNIF